MSSQADREHLAWSEADIHAAGGTSEPATGTVIVLCSACRLRVDLPVVDGVTDVSGVAGWLFPNSYCPDCWRRYQTQ